MYFSKNLETMSIDNLTKLQEKKFNIMINEIFHTNKFYQKKFTKYGITPDMKYSLSDLKNFPFTYKDELLLDQKQNPPFGDNKTYPISRYIRYHQTSGTTGLPLKILDTQKSWNWWKKLWGYVYKAAGVIENDKVFLAFSFGPFIGFWSAAAAAELIGATLIPGGGLNTLQRINLIKETGSTVLCCTPTYALHLAEVGKQNGINIKDLPIHIMIHAGEPGASIPSVKLRIQSEWNAKCYDHYGLTEVGAIGFECEMQDGNIHINETEFIPEVIDPKTGIHVLDNEEGELVITNLGRFGFPVIRYRTGDIVKYTRQPCNCGRTLGRIIGGVVGRADEMFTVRGINVFPSAIENILHLFKEVGEFRIVASKENEMDELLIEIEDVQNNKLHSTDKLEHKIVETMRNRLFIRVNIKTVSYGSLPRFELKAKRIVRKIHPF